MDALGYLMILALFNGFWVSLLFYGAYVYFRYGIDPQERLNLGEPLPVPVRVRAPEVDNDRRAV
jgi:hypothetical protein